MNIYFQNNIGALVDARDFANMLTSVSDRLRMMDVPQSMHGINVNVMEFERIQSVGSTKMCEVKMNVMIFIPKSNTNLRYEFKCYRANDFSCSNIEMKQLS